MRSPRIKPYKGLNTFDDVFDFVPVEACAKAMHTTPEQVIKLVKSGALRHTGGYEQLLVEPVIVV
jgi:hypothetical protein